MRPIASASLSPNDANRLDRTRTTDPVALENLLDPGEQTIERIMRQICATGFIRENMRHNEVASGCWLHVCTGNPIPNACASHGHTQCGGCGEALPPQKTLAITFNGGLGRFAGLLSSLVTAPLLLDRQSGRYMACKDQLLRCAGLLSEPDGLNSPLAAGIREQSRQACRIPGIVPLASDLASGMMALVLAHELAHLSYGHVQGTTSMREVTRNSEREADSFAASVLVSLPNPDRVLVGGVAFWACLALAERHHQKSSADTHPRSMHRLVSLIESAPSAMEAAEAAHGLSRDGLLSLVS